MQENNAEINHLPLSHHYTTACFMNAAYWITREGTSKTIWEKGVLKLSASSYWCHSLQPEHSSIPPHLAAASAIVKHPKKNKAPHSLAKTVAPPASKGMALVVEEDEQVRNLIALILKRMGFTALLAISHREGLDIIDQHPTSIHVAILGVYPTENAAKELSASLEKHSPGSPVIFSASHSHDQVPKDFQGNKTYTLLAKPWTAQQLSAFVLEACKKHQM